MSLNEAHIGGSFGPDSCHPKDAEQMVDLCSGNQFFLDSTGFGRSNCRYATWHLPYLGQRWTQID